MRLATPGQPGMKTRVTPLAGVIELEPRVHEDSRGFFFESYNERSFFNAIGESVTFVQDNHSRSQRHVLRGLHYQVRQTQGKLVRAIAGSVFDVAVDLRRSSATFGQWHGCILSAENKKQLWIPPGLAHGFLVLSEQAEVLYKATDFYAPHHERTLRWNDKDLGIDWPLTGTPILSDKDRAGTPLQGAEIFP